MAVCFRCHRFGASAPSSVDHHRTLARKNKVWPASVPSLLAGHEAIRKWGFQMKSFNGYPLNVVSSQKAENYSAEEPYADHSKAKEEQIDSTVSITVVGASGDLAKKKIFPALYFDSYGIIRDIMQNHLLQILALFAMETPVSLDAEDIRNEKFRHVPGNLYKRNFGTDLDKATNELVIRVQPDEAIYLKINNKIPGLGMRLDSSNLNLLYASRYPREIPDAYERLLLDAIEGERRLFIRSDELDAAWALFTPVLKELDDKRIAPELYPYGSRGPVGAHYLAAKYKVRWGDLSSQYS
ncbi:hypothetical protein B296_00029778 [Ensete ventricosum]|uniref:Glucose-6-phosphate dehydrogenase C-terminal domain-containing protein n=1 Tax=Ensete ventricosum TaxID=4639 RepID=A0A427AKA7_ENSVE|nr:hypothetical protein B296_00029778 [Ensete ventricosum]